MFSSCLQMLNVQVENRAKISTWLSQISSPPIEVETKKKLCHSKRRREQGAKRGIRKDEVEKRGAKMRRVSDVKSARDSLFPKYLHS